MLAASPVETARILLESELDGARDVGRNLVDHMVASYVLIERLASHASLAHPLAHHTLVDPGVNADAASKRPYRGAFTLEVAGPAPLETLGLERMVAGDEVDRHRATLIHAMGEVFASRRRYVDLEPASGSDAGSGADAGKRDAYGRRVPRIHFGWTREDERRARDMQRACVTFADALAAPGSRLIPFVDPLSMGAGHEAGTCAAPDLLDAAGRLRALGNVWIGDASWMPTAGDRHPTLTLLAHALHVARGVARSLASVAVSRRPG